MTDKIFSPRLRLWLPLLVALLLFMAGSVLTVFEFLDRRGDIESAAVEYVSLEMGRIQEAIEHELREGGSINVERLVTSTATNPVVDYTILSDQHGVILYATDFALKGRMHGDVHAEDTSLIQKVSESGRYDIHFTEGHGALHAFYPVQMGLQPGELREHAVGVLCMRYDLRRKEMLLQSQLMNRLIFYWSGILIVGILLLVILHYWLTRPISALRGLAKEMGRGNLSARIETKGDGEFAELAATLNQSAERLQVAYKSLDKFSTAIGQSSEAILITDAKGRVEYANPAYVRQTGYSMDEVIGNLPPVMKEGREARVVARDLWLTLRKHQSWSRKITGMRKDGKKYPAIMSVTPLLDGEKMLNHIVVLKDMTEFEVVEEQLRQAQKMEAVGTLVGGIAHDFNNILAGIIGKIYLAKRCLKPDEEGLGEHLATIESLSQRAAELIRQLLTFARKDMVKMGALPLIPFMKEASKLLRFSLPENIAFSVTSEKEDIIVWGDATQLQQVLVNLVNNARDAVAGVDAPHIRLDIRAIEADKALLKRHPELELGGYARIEVKDNGHGIDEKLLPHIFEPFYTTKEVGKGTGLGLSMVFGAARTHGGAVEVHSAVSKGATFILYLPLMKKMTDSGKREAAKRLKRNRGL